jgi:hypothetical protein
MSSQKKTTGGLAIAREKWAVGALSLHHDISTATREEVVNFTLAESPTFRETKKK